MRYDTSVLFRRRQFVLGPRFVDSLPHWKRLSVRDGLCITAHPELGTIQAVEDSRSITLLGFILDPARPDATDRAIVDELLGLMPRGLDAVIEATYSLGGRWILILDSGTERRLLHDAAGFRQVFYTRCAGEGTNWYASDCGIIARLLQLPPDPDAARFIGAYQQASKEYWWPGDTSLFSDVRKLLPNHYIDLNSGGCHRYWPTRDLRTISLADCVQQSSEILLGLMRSAHRRFPLTMAITAGWDSRVVLAATRAISSDVLYFTGLYWDLTRAHDDIRIPSQLLPKLGVRYHVIACPPSMDESFAEIYHDNVTTAHEVYGTIAQGLFRALPENGVMMKAVVSETARRAYLEVVPRATNDTVDPPMLAEAIEAQPDGFLLAAFDRWLAGADRSLNVDVLDLMYWEQRMGSWQAMAQLEWDIVEDAFAPFNCRTLLINLLSLDPEFRVCESPIVYIELMKRMWPDVLNLPINPSKGHRSVKTAVRQLVMDSGIRRMVPNSVKKLGRPLLYPPRRY